MDIAKISLLCHGIQLTLENVPVTALVELIKSLSPQPCLADNNTFNLENNSLKPRLSDKALSLLSVKEAA